MTGVVAERGASRALSNEKDGQLLFNRSLRSLLSFTVISSCILPATLHADDQSGRLGSTVDHAYRPLLARYDVPGIAVEVTIDGRERFFNYGLASRAAGAPVTQDTIFEIGSVSKTFTATLASYAQAIGKLSLDEHPGKYLPALRGTRIDQATLLNLGTFTAGGLPLQVPDAVTNDAEMVTYLQQWKAAAPIGEQRRYSNASIGLLGYLTGLAMQDDFSGLVETELFPKLGLQSSFIRVPASAMSAYAWGYDKAGEPIRVHPGVFDAEAYGVKSTAADMIRFVKANISPDRLDASMRNAIQSTHIGYFASGELVQGIGWEQYPYPVTLDRLLAGNSDAMTLQSNPARQVAPPPTPSRPTLFDKTGSTNGFAAYVAFVPAEHIGVVMLANKNFPIPERIKAAYAVLSELAHERQPGDPERPAR
jgi:beta-lactamase class C